MAFLSNYIMVGVEAANGWVKALSSVSETGAVDTYLNTLTPSNESEYRDYKKGVGTKEVYKVNGKYYKVGLPKAEGLGTIDFATRNNVKYGDDKWQAAFIIAIYRQVKNAMNLKHSKLLVATGLPANDDKKSSIKNLLKSVFIGTHTVNDQEFSLADLYFIGQGTATFYNDLYTVTENFEFVPNKNFLLDTAPIDKKSISRIMYVDFGFSTLDYRLVFDYVVQDKALERNGMKPLWNEIIQKVAAKDEANEWLVDVDILQIEDQIREGKEVKLNYQTADISEVYNEVMSKYAEDAIKNLYVGDFDNLVYDQVRFLGGGSIPLKPFLEEAIEKYHKGNKGRMDAYVFLDNPQTTNCKGYLKYAQANARKRIEEEATIKE